VASGLMTAGASMINNWWLSMQ